MVTEGLVVVDEQLAGVPVPVVVVVVPFATARVKVIVGIVTLEATQVLVIVAQRIDALDAQSIQRSEVDVGGSIELFVHLLVGTRLALLSHGVLQTIVVVATILLVDRSGGRDTVAVLQQRAEAFVLIVVDATVS